MKKYQSLINKKKKLEQKIEKLCNKFTDSTGLIIKNAEMQIDIQKKQVSNFPEKILANYNVQVNCEV